MLQLSALHRKSVYDAKEIKNITSVSIVVKTGCLFLSLCMSGVVESAPYLIERSGTAGYGIVGVGGWRSLQSLS